MGIELDPATSIAVVAAMGTGLMFGLVALVLTGGGGGRRYQRRLNSMQERAQGIATSESGAGRSLSRQQSATRIDRIAGSWLPRRDLLLARLERTGRSISIGRYAMAAVGLAFLSTIGLAIMTPIGIVPSLMIGLLIGTALPHLVIGRMGKRRLAAFINLFPDAIELVVRALRSGLPVSEAIVGAGHEIADPVGAEFRLIESGMRMGATSKACFGKLQSVSTRRNSGSSSLHSACSARPAAISQKPSPISPTSCGGANR